MDDIRLLYVEDSKALQKLMERTMEEIADFVAAGSLEEARVAIGAQTFSFFILDDGLPDGEGVDFVKEIRADPKHTKTPIILYSASLNNELEYKAMKNGVNESFKKPMNMLEMREHVVRLAEIPEVKVVRRELLQLTSVVWESNGRCHGYSPDLKKHFEGDSRESVQQQIQYALEHELTSDTGDISPAEVLSMTHVVRFEREAG